MKIIIGLLTALNFQKYSGYHMAVKLKHISTCSAVLFLHESHRDSGILHWDWWLLNSSKGAHAASPQRSSRVVQSMNQPHSTISTHLEDYQLYNLHQCFIAYPFLIYSVEKERDLCFTISAFYEKRTSCCISIVVIFLFEIFYFLCRA